ncbi:hypothetical protein ACLOJK_030409 [Asimina triloba]
MVAIGEHPIPSTSNPVAVTTTTEKQSFPNAKTLFCEEGARRRKGCAGQVKVRCTRLISEAREIDHRLVDAVEDDRFG